MYVENLSTNHLLKEFWKSVHICQSYCQTSRGILFGTQCNWHNCTLKRTHHVRKRYKTWAKELLCVRWNNLLFTPHSRSIFYCFLLQMRLRWRWKSLCYVTSPEVHWSDIGDAVNGRCLSRRKLRTWRWHRVIALYSTAAYSNSATRPYVEFLLHKFLTFFFHICIQTHN